MIMSYGNYGFDLTAVLKDVAGAANNFFNPPATANVGGGPAGTPRPVIMQTATGGIAQYLTPMNVGIGLAAVAALIYFTKSRSRRA